MGWQLETKVAAVRKDHRRYAVADGSSATHQLPNRQTIVTAADAASAKHYLQCTFDGCSQNKTSVITACSKVQVEVGSAAHLGDLCALAAAVKAPAVVAALQCAISLNAPFTQRRQPGVTYVETM
jgi:hypothetical protein